MASPIRVLVVEDFPTVRAFLVAAFEAVPDMQVVATAANGEAAVRAVQQARPDIVTMDIAMPGLDGLDATRRIMQESPVPIVVVSSTREARAGVTFRALEAGALAFVPTPSSATKEAAPGALAELIETVRLMAEIKVVRRRPATRGIDVPLVPSGRRHQPAIIAVGASTGGPPAILALLGALPNPAPVPILLVQHISAGFGADFALWLRDTTGHAAAIACDGEPALPGHLYMAPDELHMGIGEDGRIRLSDAPPDRGLRPSIAHLFRTVLAAYGARSAAVLLSGMGADGADELLGLCHAGAETFAQDQESALVFGMPGAAIRLSAARHVLDPVAIGALLAAMLAPKG